MKNLEDGRNTLIGISFICHVQFYVQSAYCLDGLVVDIAVGESSVRYYDNTIVGSGYFGVDD